MIFKSKKRAFTLIQILIAIILMGIAIVPISKIFLTSSRNVHRSAAILEASIFAATVLDRVSNPRFIKGNVNKIFYVPLSQKDEIKKDLDEEDKDPSYVDAQSSFSYITSFAKKNFLKNPFIVKRVPLHFKKYYHGRAYYIIKKDTSTLSDNVYKIKVKVIWQELSQKRVYRVEVLKTILEEDKLGSTL